MRYLLFLLSSAFFLPICLVGQENDILNRDEKIIIPVDDDSKFIDVMQQIIAYSEPQEEKKDKDENDSLSVVHSNRWGDWNFSCSYGGVAVAKKVEKKWRDYAIAVSKSEKADIAFIVKTLAYDSLISIGRQRSDLKKAGERIDHIHPFRFLMTVFQDEELKVGVAAIRQQIGWVKDGFFDGLIDCLKEEATRDNLLPHLNDFAKRLKLSSHSLDPLLSKGAHKEFVDYLIDNIPRQNDPNRYNM